MELFNNTYGKQCVLTICDKIIDNKAYLSEVDGLIGDGDHGINMAKGFNLCKAELKNLDNATLDQSFSILANILMGSIGGSMGPLYGSVFFGMASAIEDLKTINVQQFDAMLREGLSEIQDISSAQVGDKCIMDTLVPAVEAFSSAAAANDSFADCLNKMAAAAQAGSDSTKNLVAKIGRASRLGERSRGVLDAGSVSCAMILTTLADSVTQHLDSQ